LEAGEFSEETRQARGGSNLQVLRVTIYNGRDSGGETTTARDVVPHLEAFDVEGKPVAHTRGSWGFNAMGVAPGTITFRPTREDHPLELVAKFPEGEKAWLAGAVEPQLARGLYTIRASLRGDGLRKPALFEWRLVNPGKGGALELSENRGKWSTLPPLVPPRVGAEPQVRAPVPQPVAPPAQAAPQKPTETLDSLNSVVGDLLVEGRELIQNLLEARRQQSTTVLGIIPAVSAVGSRARNWNERVAQVVDDSALPFKDKMELDIYRESPLLIGGLSAEKIAALIENNMAVLGRLYRA